MQSGESLADKMDFDRLMSHVDELYRHISITAGGLDGLLDQIKGNITLEKRFQTELSRGPNADIRKIRDNGRKQMVMDMMNLYVEDTKEAKCGDCDANKQNVKINYAALYKGASIIKSHSYGHHADAILPITSPMLNPIEWFQHVSHFQAYDTTDSNIVLSKTMPAGVGECFAFAGYEGSVTIDLSEYIIPLSVQMYHYIPPVEFNMYNYSKQIAPREFSVYGWFNDMHIHFGDFEYITYATHEDHSSKLLQSFELKHAALSNTQRLEGSNIDCVCVCSYN